MSIPSKPFNPFPGLRPFATNEDYLFFGREEQTIELLSLLGKHRFIAVVGTSGSGKSSLVRAGLLPALHGGTMARAGSTWDVMLLRPGGDPITNLARAMLQAGLYDAEDEESLPRLRATLTRSRHGLVEAAKQSDLPPETNLLVVVDQFEELFRFRQTGVGGQESAAAFVKLLLSASAQQDQPIYVAITMRSDYLGDCSQIPGLAQAVNKGEYLIPRLNRDQRRAAIEKPVSVGGGRIATRLVHKLLNDVGDDADQLPVMQHALMRIWDGWATDRSDDEPLDLRHYELVGGLSEALSQHADEVYTELPDDRHRLIVEKLFKALTEKGADNRGIRRPTRLQQLCEIIDVTPAEVTVVIDAFRSTGRTFLMPTQDVELSSETVIDISHESLMRLWRRLNGWVEDESQSARIYSRLADTAALHREGKAGLYHDPDLQIALSWRESSRPNAAWATRYHDGFDAAMEFLEASKHAREAELRVREAARQRELEQAQALAKAQQLRAEEQLRAARWLKGLVAVVAAVAVLAVLAFFSARSARQLAESNRQLAEQRREQAQNNAMAALVSEKQAKDARNTAENLQEEFRLQAYQSDMSLVSEAYDAGNIDRVNELLEKHWPNPWEKDLRGFEWYHWWQAGHLLVDQVGNSSPMRRLAISPTRELLAVSGFPQTIVVRSIGENSDRFVQQSSHEFSAISFSPDGASLAAGHPSNGEIIVYNTDDGTAQILRPPENGGSANLAFSPNQPLMASGGDRSGGGRKSIVLWSTDSWTPTAQWDAQGAVRSLAFSSAGDLLLAGMDDSTVAVWEVGTGALNKTLSGHSKSVNSIAYSPAGTFFATAGADNSIRLWSHDLELIRSYDTFAPVNSLVFSTDGKLLAAATSGNNRVLVWTVRHQPPALELAHTITGHSRQVTGAAFLPDGTLVSISEDGYSRSWNLSHCEPYDTLRLNPMVMRLAYAADDGATLLMFDQAGTVRRWDIRTQKSLQALDNGRKFDTVAVADNGAVVAGITPDGQLGVWDTGSGKLRRGQSKRDGITNNLAMSWDGSTAAWTGIGHEVTVWNTASDEIKPVGELDGTLKAISPRGTKVALALFDRTELWDIADDPPLMLANMRGWGPEYCAAFSPDGTLIAIGSYNNNIRVHDSETGELLHTLKGHIGPVYAVAFSRDGYSLVSGGMDQTVRIWDVATGQLLATFNGHTTPVTSVDFSPGGDSVASLSNDGVVKIWRSATSEEVQQHVTHWIERADQFISARDWDKADQVLAEAMRYHPDHPDVIAKRGDLDGDLLRRQADAYLRKGQRAEAIASYAKALTLSRRQWNVESLEQIRVALTLGEPVFQKSSDWRYTSIQPPKQWHAVGFDDSVWHVGRVPLDPQAVLGREATPDQELTTSDIWMRCEFQLEQEITTPLLWTAHVGDQAEIYLNGVLASQFTGKARNHQTVSGADDARLRRGKNVVAVHCRNAHRWPTIEIGLYKAGDEDALGEVLAQVNVTQPEWLDAMARWHMSRGHWNDAGNCLCQRLNLNRDDSIAWMQAAATLALAADVNGYRELCETMREHFSGPLLTVQNADRTVKSCLLLPGVFESSELPIKLVADALDEGSVPPGLQPWYYLMRALAAYRSGDAMAASRWTMEASNRNPTPSANAACQMIQTMAEYKLGQTDASQQVLAERAGSIRPQMDQIRRGQPPESWHDWLIAEILHREAQSLIENAP